jgi:hypothetical protein
MCITIAVSVNHFQIAGLRRLLVQRRRDSATRAAVSTSALAQNSIPASVWWLQGSLRRPPDRCSKAAFNLSKPNGSYAAQYRRQSALAHAAPIGGGLAGPALSGKPRRRRTRLLERPQPAAHAGLLAPGVSPPTGDVRPACETAPQQQPPATAIRDVDAQGGRSPGSLHPKAPSSSARRAVTGSQSGRLEA